VRGVVETNAFRERESVDALQASLE
jgi:hypothetical protein